MTEARVRVAVTPEAAGGDLSPRLAAASTRWTHLRKAKPRTGRIAKTGSKTITRVGKTCSSTKRKNGTAQAKQRLVAHSASGTDSTVSMTASEHPSGIRIRDSLPGLRLGLANVRRIDDTVGVSVAHQY
jgi:hypothetical protein